MMSTPASSRARIPAKRRRGECVFVIPGAPAKDLSDVGWVPTVGQHKAYGAGGAVEGVHGAKEGVARIDVGRDVNEKQAGAWGVVTEAYSGGRQAFGRGYSWGFVLLKDVHFASDCSDHLSGDGTRR